MTRIIKVLIIIGIFFYSCDFAEINQENENIVISQDSLMKLRQYIYDTILTNAQYRINRGDTINVTSTLFRMHQTDTNNVEYIIDLANSLIAAFNIKEALSYLNLALEKDKKQSAKIYFSKSLAWSFALNSDSSYYYLGKAIEIDSSGVRYLVHRSQKYEEDSLYHNAIKDINIAINREPENKGLYVYRGIYQKGLGNYKEALLDMQIIPNYMSKNANVYGNRAFVYLKLGKFKECIHDANNSILLNPNNGGVYGVRANAKSNLQDFEGAYKDLKKAVELGNKEAIPLYEQFKEYFDTHKKI